MKHLAGRHTQQGFPLKSRTINKLVENLRTFLKYLAERGWVASSLPRALAYVKEPQLLLTSVLNHSQVKRVLAAQPAVDAETWRNRVMLEVLYSTGIRVGQLEQKKQAAFDEWLKSIHDYADITIFDLWKTRVPTEPVLGEQQ